jgi:predicted anti-sigma-YlaC factor YlaD
MGGIRRPHLFGGHLGASVSALVDGQLDAESTERAWEHVMHCPPCRRLVEHEGWVKRQLAQIADPSRPDVPSDRLLGSLLEMGPAAAAWVDVEEIEHRGRARRRAGIALVGAGSVSAAVLGLSALGGATIGGSTGVPTTSIGRASASSTPTRAVVAPSAVVHGRLRGWTLGVDADGVAHARAVADRR